MVLLFLLGCICFFFGYLYFGKEASQLLNSSQAKNGPPAPVFQEIQRLKRQIIEHPEAEEAYVELANLYFQANKFNQALLLYEKAVKLNGKDVVARNDLALSYHVVKRENEAFEQLREALKISPKSQHLWLTLGLVDYETGHLLDARKALKTAYKINPKSETGLQAKSMLASFVKSQQEFKKRTRKD